jgi:uncharacterized membrane protein
MSAIGWVHTVLAIMALATGAWNLLRPKGTTLHRWTGRAFAMAMLGLNVSALTIYRLTGRFEMFHALALLSLATLAVGIVPVLLRRPHRHWLNWHYFGISIAYAGLVAAFGSELLVRVPVLRPLVFSATIDAETIARIFRAGGILGQIATLLVLACLVWRYDAVMAKLGRRPRAAVPQVAHSISLTSLGQTLVLLGALTFLRQAAWQFWPASSLQFLSIGIGNLAIIGVLTIAYRHRDRAEDLRWLAAYYFLQLFATVWSFLFGHFGVRDFMAFSSSISLFGIVALGLFLDDALVLLGIGATFAIVIGYQFSGPWFALWLAIVTGGTQAWAGRRLLGARRPSAVAIQRPAESVT